ncbi:MAG: hypothetical protein AAGA68_23375 [Pseudomonadota bacterium]
MSDLAARAGLLSLVALGGWWAVSANSPDANQQQPEVERLSVPMSASVEVVKRMKERSGPVRVSGDRASYVGTRAYPIQMTTVKPRAATAKNGTVKVSGGRRIESPLNDAQLNQAISRAEQSANRVPAARQQSRRRGPIILNSFEAIGAEDCCVDPVPFSATVPPDPDITAGPDHIIVVVNVTFAIYDKAGNELQPPTAFSEFFAGVDPACEPGGPFDPDVVYDESTGQFILGVDGNGTDYCIAATTDGDPLGTWNRFAFPADINGEFFDFPHMGVGTDAIYVGSNQFGDSFVGGRIFAVNKDDLLNGDPIRVVQRLVPDFNSTPQPAQLRGANDGTFPTEGPNYFMTEVFDGPTHSVWAWDAPFGADVLTKLGDVDLAAASKLDCADQSCFPVSVPQAGSDVLLAGNDFRGQETEFRNGKLWTTQTVSCDPGTGVVNCARWAQIDPAEVTVGASTDGVIRAGVLTARDGVHRFFPSLAVDRCENMAIGYTKSSDSMFPSVAASGRLFVDPLNRLRADSDIIAGTEAYRSFQDPNSPNRWGDYTGMATDPDGRRFWYVGQYAAESENVNANWKTFVAELTFGCRLPLPN